MAKRPTQARPAKQSDIDVTADRLPAELKRKLEKLKPRARKYAEYRAKGLSQALAAEKAGSRADPSSGSLSRVGYGFEQQDGVKEYILWLEQRRAQASVIDDLEIVDKLREVYATAIDSNKLSDAVKAVELMGHMIGSFAQAKTSKKIKDAADSLREEQEKDKYSSFREDFEDETKEEKIARLTGMLQQAKTIVRN